MRRLACALIGCLMASGGEAIAQVVVTATRITTPIKIDGRLDDAAYREVAPLTGFIQQEPEEGAAGDRADRSLGAVRRR